MVSNFCNLALTLVFDFVNEQLDSDQRWMQEALRLASVAGENDEVPVGAIVVKDGVIVGEGWNRPITSNDPCAHAEIIALRDAAKNVENYRLVGCTLYVTIEPCAMCAGAIVHSRVDRLVFGATEPKAGAVVSNVQLLNADHVNHKPEIEAGVLAEECSEMISDFFRRRRQHKREEKKLKKIELEQGLNDQNTSD